MTKKPERQPFSCSTCGDATTVAVASYGVASNGEPLTWQCGNCKQWKDNRPVRITDYGVTTKQAAQNICIVLNGKPNPTIQAEIDAERELMAFLGYPDGSPLHAFGW